MKGYTEDTTSAWRRYSEFELLRNYLEITYPAVVVPPLPEKKVNLCYPGDSHCLGAQILACSRLL